MLQASKSRQPLKLIPTQRRRTAGIFTTGSRATVKRATSRRSRLKRSARALDLGPVGAAIDVLVGGPPCQAFARVGRSKLREIDEHPHAFKHDPRAKLYLEYLRYVTAFQPLAILMENVPDVLNHGGQNIAEEICEVLGTKGYVVRYTLLNAAFYGVPQMRERMFLIGYHRDLESESDISRSRHTGSIFLPAMRVPGLSL